MTYPPYHKPEDINPDYKPYHPQVTVFCPVNNTMVTADAGIISDLQILWHYGIGTQWSCEGTMYSPSDGNRYIMLERPEDVPAALELLPWAFASPRDRQSGAVYSRPGGAPVGTFRRSEIDQAGDLH